MRRALRRHWEILVDAIRSLARDDASLLAGAISFFTFVSLVPTLLVTILTVGWVLGRQRAVAEVLEVGQAALGPEGADALEVLVGNPSIGEGSVPVAVASVLTALYGGSRAFHMLRIALNRAWEVRQRSDLGLREKVKVVVAKRAMAILAVVGVGLAVLLSIVSKTVLAVLVGAASAFVGSAPRLWTFVELAVSTGILALFLAFLYRVLPDVEVRRRDVTAGALTAAALLALGTKALSWYLTAIAARSLSGAAATFVVTLLWLYATAFVVLLGAEITASVAAARGRDVTPSSHAERTDR